MKASLDVDECCAARICSRNYVFKERHAVRALRSSCAAGHRVERAALVAAGERIVGWEGWRWGRAHHGPRARARLSTVVHKTPFELAILVQLVESYSVEDSSRSGLRMCPCHAEARCKIEGSRRLSVDKRVAKVAVTSVVTMILHSARVVNTRTRKFEQTFSFLCTFSFYVHFLFPCRRFNVHFI